MQIDLREKQPESADFPIRLSADSHSKGSVGNCEHPEKQSLSMISTPRGMRIAVRDEHPCQVNDWTLRKREPDSKATLDNFEQPAKA
jgi:hypothetical protein